jgi:deferrochelatase/peroxidase EfeB
VTGAPGVSRRQFLAAVGSAGLAGAAGCSAPSPEPQPATAPSRVTPRQTAILGRAPSSTLLVAYDAEAPDRAALAGTLRALTDRLAGATATVAVGAGLFDDRYGLTRPRRLEAMPAFRADVLDPQWCHGDLLVQVSADDPAELTALFARPLPGLRQRWRMEGFHPPARAAGEVRNLFGFREGAGNPDAGDAALMEQLVWTQPGDGEPDWCVGGTYQVVRLIRLAMQTWDGEPEQEHERVFGRHKTTGAPLGRTRETEEPDFAADPDGQVIALDAHIRRANPRTPESQAHRILRRGYSYKREPQVSGTQDTGQIFICYQRDIEAGFATIQRRLSGEALERYTMPFGGGYYFVLPAAGAGAHLGQTMLAS